MAITRLYPVATNGYGQIEPNRVSFPRTGAIEAQLPFYDADATKVAENGMLLEVNPAAGKVTYPTSTATIGLIGLHYSTEHLYDQFKPGLKNFYLGVDGGDFYPRIGFLEKGEVFTTNALCADIPTEFANVAAVEAAMAACATTPLFGGISTTGLIYLSATPPSSGPFLSVIAKTTMPDGSVAAKFSVVHSA